MSKFKKVAAVAVMVGGMALGGGVAHAGDGPYDGPHHVIIPNLQKVECNQKYDGGGISTHTGGGATGGDTHQAIGNFCTVVGPVSD
jgi:hypothetical protein